MHNNFHFSLLERYVSDQCSALKLPPLIEVDGKNEYKLIKLLGVHTGTKRFATS